MSGPAYDFSPGRSPVSPNSLDVMELIVQPKFALERLDHFLVRHQVHASRTVIQRLIKEGDIRVNERVAKPHYKIRPGDHIVCRIPAPTPLEILPEDIPLDVLFEDETLLVINKPPGLVMHPAPGHYTGTLVHALLSHCRDLGGIGGKTRPGLVHRLDKDTSGVLVVAKTDRAHRALSAQFKDHSIHRLYLAVVVGRPARSHGTIDRAIGRDRWHRKRISHQTNRPRKAVTGYRIRERFAEAALVEVIPQTGRTHQIRVHFASLGHPVLGDPIYGGRRTLSDRVRASRQMLHAETLGFTHPDRGEWMEFKSPLPEDFQSVLEILRQNPKGD